MKKYADYRKTSSPFLKTVPSHWIDVKLRHCYTIKSISNTSNEPLLSVFLNRGVVSYTDTDMKQVHKPSEDMKAYQLVLPGDFVLNNQQAWRGSVGVSSHRGIVSPAYIVMAPITENNPRFMNYMLRETACISQFVLASKGVGSIQRILSPIKLKSSIVVLPPRDEQDQIVRYLDWQVSKINRLLAIKKRIVLDTFDLIQLFLYSEKGDRTSIGVFEAAFPQEWERKKAKYLFVERNDKNHPEEELLAVTQDRGILFKKDCPQNFVMPADTTTQKLVSEGDYIISLRSFQGGIETSHIRGLVSAAYTVMYLRPEFAEYREYFEILFKSSPFIKYLNSLVNDIRDGKKIDYSDFKNSVLPLPPKALLQKITLLLRKYEKAKSDLEVARTVVNNFRTRLISDVVTGQIDVRGIEVPTFEYIDESNNNDENTEEMEAELDG